MTEPIGIVRHGRRTRATLLVLFATSCTMWRPLPGASLAPAQSERLRHAKVFLRDGTELELENVTIRPDSIIGLGGDTHTRLSVARREVAAVEAPEPDAQKTFLAGALVTVALAFLYAATILALLYGSND